MDKKEIYLDVINIEECEQVRRWRNKLSATLRTPYNLTYEQQQDFYKNIICNRDSKHRYFGIYVKEENKLIGKTYEDAKYEPTYSDEPIFIGLGGIINIQWENGLGEISLIIDPKYTGKGYGKKSVELLLDKAFNEMRLDNIYGECYRCNQNIGFWENIIRRFDGTKTNLPNRKFFNGQHYNALYFNFNKTLSLGQDKNEDKEG
jgi:RimJ/RimL family protein N-acetyltransferase